MAHITLLFGSPSLGKWAGGLAVCLMLCCAEREKTDKIFVFNLFMTIFALVKSCTNTHKTPCDELSVGLLSLSNSNLH